MSAAALILQPGARFRLLAPLAHSSGNVWLPGHVVEVIEDRDDGFARVRSLEYGEGALVPLAAFGEEVRP